jgi:Spy/CpxP family protein refolding chaperone
MHLLRTVGWSFMLSFCCVAATLAEDPIVVHYSDPSLTRLEKQLGITAAQRDRFDDIVVKYRDPLNNIAAANANESDTQPSGNQGRKHARSEQARSGRSGAGSFGGARRNMPRQELDELATILTPEQIKRFEELSAKKAKRRGGAHDS